MTWSTFLAGLPKKERRRARELRRKYEMSPGEEWPCSLAAAELLAEMGFDDGAVVQVSTELEEPARATS